MTPGRLIAIIRSWIGVLAASLVLGSTAWLLAEYVHALRVTPAETALVEALKEKARTDAEVQKTLQPEFDRQREALARRHRAYDRGGVLLLISLGVLLAWARWLKPDPGDWVGVPRWLAELAAQLSDRQLVAAPPAGSRGASAGQPADAVVSWVPRRSSREYPDGPPAGRRLRPTSSRSGSKARTGWAIQPVAQASVPARGLARPHAQRRTAEAGPVEIRIGLGTCGLACGALEVRSAFEESIAALGGGAIVKPVGCAGTCRDEPLVEIVCDRQRVRYGKVGPRDARAIARAHVRPRGIVRRVRGRMEDLRGRLLDDHAWIPIAARVTDPTPWTAKQVRVALENCGAIDPRSLDDYRRRHGFAALDTCVTRMSPDDVVEVVRAAGLRGRGGSGTRTAEKWDHTRRASALSRRIICRSDGSEPRTFIDRMLLEGDPFRVIEGMAIAAYAVGAHTGIIQLERTDPVAVSCIREAIAAAEANGWLGQRILGGAFRFTVELRKDAEPTEHSDDPAVLIHHVETLATVPWVLRHGPAAFAALGAGRSTGTKVLSLAGRVTRGGFIEVPLGTSIRDIVEGIGGGVEDGRLLKAVLIGGRAGACIPASAAETRIDYEEVASFGASLGSGGLVVLDERDCMVEVARRYVRAVLNQAPSPGSVSREDATQMLAILERIRQGQGTDQDLVSLEALSLGSPAAGAGGAAPVLPNTVHTTLRHFRDEYEAHVREHRCPAAACKALIHYRVLDSCNGCTLCAQACRTGAIQARPYLPHAIDDDRCKRCGMCLASCPEHAIEVS